MDPRAPSTLTGKIVLGRMGTRGRYVCRLHVRRQWGPPDHGLLMGRKEKDAGVAVRELDSIGARAGLDSIGAAWHFC